MPYSRATIAACETTLPVSAITAAARTKSGVHAGFVYGATSTSPGRSAPNSATSRTMRTGPMETPGAPGMPLARALSGVGSDGNGIIGTSASSARFSARRATV
ncbi:MAG: hypothetical protein U0031_02495, partial [Thermomicrobiales bacterium]